MNDKIILDLIDKFTGGNLTELKFSNGEINLNLRKGSKETTSEEVVLVTSDSVNEKAGIAVQPESKSQQTAKSPVQVKQNSDVEIVTSPIVGTFYRSGSPDSPPFVTEGIKIEKGKTLCILEAMKMMNHLEADFSCKIQKILVDNGSIVEFGTPLFEVSKA